MHTISLRNAAAIGNATSEMRRLGWSPHWTWDEQHGLIELELHNDKGHRVIKRISTASLEFSSFDLIWRECEEAMTELQKIDA